MKTLTKRQVIILVLSIFGTVLIVVLVIFFLLSKGNKALQSKQDETTRQQQGKKETPGSGGTVGALGGSQDKKDGQVRPLKSGSIQEAEDGIQSSGSETDVNTMKPKNNSSTDQKVTKVNNETYTAEPLKTDQTGNATEPGKENSGAESLGKVGAEDKQLTTEAKNEKQQNETEVHSSQSAAASTKSGTESSVKANEEKKQLTTESVTTEALSTMNSQQVDDLIAKSKAVNASTPAETLTLNSNVALLSLTKKIKDEYASDANAQAWMNSGFQMQELDSIDHDKNFDTRFFPPSPPQG